VSRRAWGGVLLSLVLLLAGAMVAAFLAYRWIEREHSAPGPSESPIRFQVAPGASARSVLTRLESMGALPSARRTELYLRLTGRRLNVKVGEYEIPARASPADIVERLEQGRVVLESLTIVEGSRFADLRAALERHPGVKVTLRSKSDEEIMALLGHPGEHPEGRFFPDTYHFAAGTTDLQLLRHAFERMQRILAEAWEQRRENLPLETPYEALILASIVEKETALESERPRIAGVFINRLRRGMRLQSDPTVIYGIGPAFDGDIRSRDLVTDTPYNTYTRAGLPPTPIALPGREALYAVVQPAETEELYFVATGLGDGSHHFSRTLEEHNQAVKRYLARLKQRPRSSTGAGAPQPKAQESATPAEAR